MVNQLFPPPYEHCSAHSGTQTERTVQTVQTVFSEKETDVLVREVWSHKEWMCSTSYINILTTEYAAKYRYIYTEFALVIVKTTTINITRLYWCALTVILEDSDSYNNHVCS